LKGPKPLRHQRTLFLVLRTVSLESFPPGLAPAAVLEGRKVQEPEVNQALAVLMVLRESREVLMAARSTAAGRVSLP
jgi:hypothetical protein